MSYIREVNNIRPLVKVPQAVNDYLDLHNFSREIITIKIKASLF